ncbi:hypothetical protein [Bosea sp. (in: a-proteobacteria)]|jgi:hypothetical protein|uniref:hypothetical protein n=1 Tax=Bosea sp. (in: a-proteobacteria) TaxID=1871050 RepID=UPI003F6EAF4D
MQVCDSTYRDEVVEGCRDALVANGFTRYRKRDVDYPFLDGFHCWVGLASEMQPDCIKIYPQVGVHAVNIEKLWSRLTTGKYAINYNRAQCTYGGPLSGLTDGTAVTTFSRGCSISQQAERLATLYLEFGVPYARSLAGYEALLPELKTRIPILGGYPQRVAACLYLMGRKEESLEFADHLRSLQIPQLDDFALSFVNMVKEEWPCSKGC